MAIILFVNNAVTKNIKKIRHLVVADFICKLRILKSVIYILRGK